MDTLTFLNGDRVTGEIKGLGRGKLTYSTTALGTVDVKWVHVRRLESPRFFEVTVKSGQRHFGALAAGDSGVLVVHVAQFFDTVRLADVVEMAPIGSGFVQRLEGYVNVGYTLAKANNNTQLTAGAEVRYRPRGWSGRITTDFYSQDQDPGSATTRGTVVLSGLKFIHQRWAAGVSTGAEHNDEIGLNLRSTLGALGGLSLVRGNEVEAVTYVALIYTVEEFVAAVPAHGFEAALAAEADVFRFGDHELDVSLRFTAYPSLSDWGRVRAQSDARANYEVITNFTVGLTAFHTYDSRPPGGTGAVTDYGTSFTIGWKF